MSDKLPFSDEHLTQFKSFIELCKKEPSILHNSQLSFFKSYIESLGGQIPQQEPESEESDLELDMTNVIEPDTDEPQPMGDYELQPTEEQVDQSVEKRSEAMAEYRAKNYEKAIELYTESIKLDPTSPISYAKRAQVYIALKKPNACIRDCERALEINPDSALAHKMRGRAYQLLGKWVEAANDLRIAVKADFDEEANEWLNEVTPNVKKIEEHKRKKERKQRERQERERQERLRKAREAQEKARAEAAKAANEGCCGGGGTGPCSGNANAAGGPNLGQFGQFLNDPEVLQAFQDPEVAAAFKDVASNPSNLFKYQSNPKVMSVINKIASKFGSDGGDGGMGGMGGMMGGLGGMMGGLGGMMGGLGGMGGMGGGAAPPQPPKSSEPDDFGLD